MKGKLTQYVENHGYGGLTHLSSKIGISKEQLRLIIAGKTKNPSVYTVAKIAEVLECSIEELIGKNDPTKYNTLHQLHSADALYKKKLFLAVCDYVVKYLSDHTLSNIKFYNVIRAIDTIYDYSTKKTNQPIEGSLDIEFAKWYCQSFLK